MPTLVLIVVLLAASASAGFFSAEHLMTDRDPGVYLGTARWLADEGTLLVSGTVGGFSGIEHATAASPSFFDTRGDDTIDPQFLHLLPVWGAVAHWVGGDQALLRINAVVIALALAAVWLFSATVMRPWFAVLATVSVAVMLPTIHFARDLYTEPMAMLFVFAGLAFIGLARRAEQPGLSFIAGLAVGGVAMVRIDGWLVIAAVLAYVLAVWWRAAEAESRATIDRFVHWALLGMFASGTVAMFDAAVRSRPYFIMRGSQVTTMFGLLLLVVVLGVIGLSRPTPVRRLIDCFADYRRALAWVIPIVVVVTAGLLFFVRPMIQEVHRPTADPHIESLQEYEGIPIDGTRTYNERTVQWLSWYVGLAGLALGVIGLAWMWRLGILDSGELWPFLLVATMTTAVYVIRPSVAPDQLWAMRRFLPVVLPALAIGAAFATQWALERIGTSDLQSAAAPVSRHTGQTADTGIR
jgi:hypothetical protein